MTQPLPVFRKRQKRSAGSAVAFLCSSVGHLVVALTLSFIVLGSQGEGFRGLQLIGTDAGGDPNEDLEHFEIASTPPLAANDVPPPELPDSEREPLDSQAEFAAASILADRSLPGMESSLSAEASIAVLLGGGSGWESNARGGDTPASALGTGATFFGARADGYRFVFVIDSSSSMIGPRWEALRVELHRALKSLSPDQEFFVIGFDSDARPMFGTLPPKGKFLHPTAENLEKLNRWVGSIQHGGHTFPASAIGIALRLNPDAIFLLSDGEIRDSTLNDLRTFNRRMDEEGHPQVVTPIHTVLLHSDVGYLALRTISDENEGVFTPVWLYQRQQ